MTALTEKASGRAALVLLAIGAALLLLTSLLVSNATAAVTETILEGVEGDACQELYGVDGWETVIPAQPSRYNETFNLDGGVVVTLTAPPNRKFVDFTIQNATVDGAILFNRIDQDQGNWYDYDPAQSSGRVEPPPRDSGNDKKFVLCFNARTEVSIDKVTTFGTALQADSTSDYIPVGTSITWEYRVSIPAGGPAEALTINSVTDDQPGVTPTLISGDDGDNILEPGETWLYRATGTAILGAYTNLGTVNAQGVGSGTAATDSDGSGYFGASPAIGIAKTTSGYDLDAAEPDSDTRYAGPGDGVFIEADDGVVWTYVVTNQGNVPLSNVSVTDDQPGVNPTLISGDDGDGILGLTETWTYEALGTAETSSIGGGYSNVGTASATAPTNAGTVSNATDGSSYFGYVATFDVEVDLIVDGETYDPTTDPFPIILAGESITWRFTATNTGNVPVTATIVAEIDGETETTVCTLGNIPPGDVLGNPASCDYDTTAGDGENSTSFNVIGSDPNGFDVEEPIDNIGYYGGVDCGTTVLAEKPDTIGDGPDVGFWVGPVSDPDLECGTAVVINAYVSDSDDTQVAEIIAPVGYPFIGTGVVTIDWDAIPRDDEPLVRTVQELTGGNDVIEQCAVIVPIQLGSGGDYELVDPAGLYPGATDFDGSGTYTENESICLIQQFNYQVDVGGEVYMQLQEVYYIWNDPILIRPK